MDRSESDQTIKVLVMDDESVIRETVKKVLETAGCAVDTARDGRQAIALFESAHGGSRPYEAVLLDLTVPGADGAVAALRGLRLIDPALKAIVTSGYHNSPVMQQPEKFGFCARLKKPWDIEELRRLIKAVARPAVLSEV